MYIEIQSAVWTGKGRNVVHHCEGPQNLFLSDGSSDPAFESILTAVLC